MDQKLWKSWLMAQKYEQQYRQPKKHILSEEKKHLTYAPLMGIENFNLKGKSILDIGGVLAAYCFGATITASAL